MKENLTFKQKKKANARVGEHLLVIIVEVDVDLVQLEQICTWRKKIRAF